MKSILKKHSVFLLFLLLFCLLLFKDPFSQRTLIPNFEPFPDALYYVDSAINFVEGNGLAVIRENRVFNPPIPPLYSLALAPVFLISVDPRMFYFGNIAISILSFYIFYKILGLLKINKFTNTLLLFLYSTNYFLYWLPTLAMAENLILLIFLSSIFLLLSGISNRKIILATFLGVGFYATKYASISLTAAFLGAYFVKLLNERTNKKILYKRILFFIISLCVFTVALFLYEELTKRTSPLHSLDIVRSSLLKSNNSISQSSVSTSSTPGWFSLSYFNLNIGHYINSLTGGSERFLWDFTPILPKPIAIVGLFGLAVGTVIKKYRLASLTLIMALAGTVIFMATLYTYDIRYIYIAIPTLLLGVGIFISISFEKLNENVIKMFLFILISIFVIYYGMTNFTRIKSQISLNLRYSETPWYYVSILKMNEYFTKDKIINNKKPFVVSALPPYLVDFFSNGNYLLLPLSYQQEFRNMKETVWGPNDYSDLPKLYETYIKGGHAVYLAKYGLGNEGYTNQDFQVIMSRFKTQLVMQGCFEQCNIYKLSVKDEK